MAGRASTKTWGPFSGRMLMTLGAAVIACLILVPGTVQALTRHAQDPAQATATATNKPFSVSVQDDSSLYVVGPTISTVHISNLTLAVADGTTGIAGFEFSEFLVPQANKNCLAHQTFVRVIWSIPHFDAATPVSMSFPTPLQIHPPTGKKVCLYGVLRTNPIPVRVNVSGYLS